MNQWLDDLTSTHTVDRDFSDLMARAPFASLIAELLVWNEWRNQHLASYLTLLPVLAEKRFKRDQVELASQHSHLLILASTKDLALPVYLAIRGLPLDGLFFMRRALEHLAVFTHVWKHPNRLHVLDEPESEMYRNAFQLGPPNYHGGAVQWRFEAFALLGREASNLYRTLSSFTAHGGPNAAKASAASHLSCRILSRQAPDESFQEVLEVLVESTKIVSVNLCALFRHYMLEKNISNERVERANGEAFALLRSAPEGSVSVLAQAVQDILRSIDSDH